MAYSGLQAKIQLIIGLAGIKIFCLGILLFASSYMVEDLLKDYGYGYDFGRNHCEYWAALPTILTGVILVLSVNKHFKRYHEFLSYLRICCTLIVMVLALGVMIEEATDNSWSHSLVYSECRHIQPLDDPINDHINDPEDLPDEHEYHIASFQERKKTCDMLLKADKWYYVMLFTSDIVLVISIIALFAMFAQWMVFTALKTPENGEHSAQMSERYERFSASEPQEENTQQMWEGESGDKTPLHPV